MPAAAAVAAFLADRAAAGVRQSTLGRRVAAGVRQSTLGRRVAAIAYTHDLAGMALPAAAKLVLAVLGGARRVKGAKPAQKAPATAERVPNARRHA